MMLTYENAISGKKSLKMRPESRRDAFRRAFSMRRLAECKNLTLVTPPPYNRIVFPRTEAHSAHKNDEFGATNSFPALDKGKFVVTNSFPALDKHEFVVANSFPAFNKYEFVVTNSFPAFNKYEFAVTNSFSALDKYEFGATNFISAYKKHEFVAQDEFAGLSATAASIKMDLLRFHARANGKSKTVRKGCDKAWRKPCDNKRSIA